MGRVCGNSLGIEWSLLKKKTAGNGRKVCFGDNTGRRGGFV